MNMIPSQTADFSGGQILHVTMEVDLHQDGRRWTGIELVPANDPLTSFNPVTNALNQSDHALFFDYFPGQCSLEEYTGPSKGPGSTPNIQHLWGGVVHANKLCDLSDIYNGGYGINLDNRGKLDLFVSQNHAALFINGQLIIESDIPGGLPFTQAQVYFTHFVYHTSNDVGELQQYAPWETFWVNYYHWSDERHWDNMGFEVFPSAAAPTSANWKKLVAIPNSIAPQLAPSANSGNGNSTITNPLGGPVIADVPSSSIQ
jgi:hypothetical protein